MQRPPRQTSQAAVQPQRRRSLIIITLFILFWLAAALVIRSHDSIASRLLLAAPFIFVCVVIIGVPGLGRWRTHRHHTNSLIEDEKT